MRSLALVLLWAPVVAMAQQRPKIDGPLSLDQAIAVAQRYSPQIAGALADVSSAHSSTSAARARKGPQLSLNGFASSGNEMAIASTPPGSDPAAIMNLPQNGFTDANLSLMLPLYTGGALEGAIAAARWAERASESTVVEARSDSAIQVAEAYLAYLRNVAMAANVAQRLVSQQEITRITRVNVEAGKDIPSSVGRAEAEESAVRRELESANNEIAKSLVALNGAMGVDFESKPELTDTLAQGTAPETLDKYLSEATTRRGSLLAASQKLKSAQADARSSEGALRPQVYGFAMGDTSNGTPSSGGVVGLTMSLPVFDGGMRRADVNRSRAMASRAEADLRTAQIAVEQEVRMDWLDFQTADRNLALAQSAVDPMVEAYRTVTLRYAIGKSTLLEQFQALESVTRARTDLAQAQYDRRIALARLERAAGMLPHSEGAKS